MGYVPAIVGFVPSKSIFDEFGCHLPATNRTLKPDLFSAMSAFTFLHAADIHLDSPLRRLGQYDEAVAERLRTATRVALANLVDLAIAESVAFVIIAGDLYDGDWDDVRTGLYMVQQMRRLNDAGIRVFAIAGNHDAATKMTYNVPQPENVTILSHKASETYRVDGLDVAIHGRSFASQAVTENLAKSYPTAVPNVFNIGILHTSLDGREGHASYAPCTLSDLREKGYDYWALGHVHTRETVCQDPWVVFPGNIQGRSVRETGERGAMLVTVERGAAGGGLVRTEFHPLDDARWLVLEVDASPVESPEGLIDLVRTHFHELKTCHEPRAIVVRIEITGTSAFSDVWHGNERKLGIDLLAVAQSISQDIVIDKIRLRTTQAGRTGVVAEDDEPLAAIDEVVRQYLEDEALAKELAKDLGEHLGGKLPTELTDATEPFRIDAIEFVKGMVANSGPLLRQRMARQPEGQEKGDK